MLTRSFTPSEIEIRVDGADGGRTVFGRVAPFDELADINENGRRFREIIRRGAFARTITERGPERVKLLALHDNRRLPLGRAVELREASDGLYGSFRVSKTVAGDEALELIHDRALDAFSVGFSVPKQGDRWSRDGVRELLSVRLHEVSLVTQPAYASAMVAGVRGDAGYRADLDPEILERQLRLALLTRSTPHVQTD
jgi:uncharacterized protein